MAGVPVRAGGGSPAGAVAIPGDDGTLRLDRLLEAAEEALAGGGARSSKNPGKTLINATRITVIGPHGVTEMIRITQADTHKTIEHCLRTLFTVPAGASMVLRDRDGSAVPMGPGLLTPQSGSPTYTLEIRQLVPHEGSSAASPGGCAAHSGFRTPETPEREPLLVDRDGDELPRQWGEAAPEGWPDQREEKVRVLETALGTPEAPPRSADGVRSVLSDNGDEEQTPQRFGRIGSPKAKCQGYRSVLDRCPVEDTPVSRRQWGAASPRLVRSATAQWMSSAALEEEIRFWCRLASNHTLDVAGAVDSAEMQAVRLTSCKWDAKLRQSPFDTSPQRIDALYDSWMMDGPVNRELLRDRLASDCDIELTPEQLDQALSRTCSRFQDAVLKGADAAVPKTVFASLFQRLVLGILCGSDATSPESEVRLIEYCEHHDPVEQEFTQQHFLFGGHHRDRDRENTVMSLGGRPRKTARTTRWAMVEESSGELILKLGAKFFLHPLATEDMLKAAATGTSKVERYRNQYFVSLEVYAIDAVSMSRPSSSKGSLDGDNADVPAEFRRLSVGSRITRSTISLLATGNPPTRSQAPMSRDWLLTVINNSEQRTKANLDFLDRFRSDRGASQKILMGVRDDVMSHKRQREYQADFLLYSVIDRAAGELKPIFNAYGRRLRWMQEHLDQTRHNVPRKYVDEVLTVHLELQELKAWICTIKNLVKYLEHDSRLADKNLPTSDGQLNFGWGQGKSMRIFIRRTQDHLDEAIDSVAVLDDMVNSFSNDVERYKSDFMNQVLLVLTVATAIFLPAQFMTGVYGMNFVDLDDGSPGIPELTWQHGYIYFWCVAGSILLGGSTLVYCCLNCQGHQSPVRRCFRCVFWALCCCCRRSPSNWKGKSMQMEVLEG